MVSGQQENRLQILCEIGNKINGRLEIYLQKKCSAGQRRHHDVSRRYAKMYACVLAT